jgi:CheY-like chemotaxis protein
MIDLRYVLSESLRLVEHGLATHGVELVRHHDTSVYVNGDITQLMQVVLNLINNARDAMMPGGGELTITLREHDQSAIVEVRDTGCGIPEELLARIFEPFMTTKGALAGSTVSGTGLGLSVSYGIITAHGGELQVESQIGAGSTFRIVLPLAFSRVEREPEVAEEEAPRRPVDRALRLLVVEDEPEVRRFMGTMLEFAGHDVTCVGSGAEALLELAAQPCDVIVSDLMMPAMSGIELIRRLRERGDLTPVILVTGRNDMLPNELDTYDSRMYFIQKPFATEDLFRTLTLAVS